MISQLYVMATLTVGDIVQFHPERILNPDPAFIPNRIWSAVLIGWLFLRVYPNCTNAQAHQQLSVELFWLGIGTVVLLFVT